MTDQKRESLGTNVVPHNYRLALDINMKSFTYRGKEEISVKVEKPTDTITLNAELIKIESASISIGQASYPAKVSYDKKLGRIALKVARKISGKATIEIVFQGKNEYNMRGFYRSKYSNKGKEGWLLTTQFEPVSARCAFPCFDEPSLKATFDLSLIIDDKLTAVSNMPLLSEKKEKGRKTVSFRTTPVMSTYLLYMGVGPFEQIKWRAMGLDFRVLTAPGKSGELGLAKEYATKFMGFQQSYFRVKYPLSKMDFLAIPDFQAGAMENWGAITAREMGLLGDAKTASVPIKRYVAVIVSHELAHQWFGDLVTMQWWNDLWLNESFATFMEEKSIETIYPKWKMRINHIVNDTAGLAMGDDQLRSTHPIHVEVNSPSDIDSIFDTISYQKGAAVLRMLEDYVTPEIFRGGLKHYFTKHAYSNAVKEDLWNSIAGSGGKSTRDLPSVARFWIENAGFPVVHADGPKNGKVHLRQERFTLLPNRDKRKTWPIPVRYITDKGEGFVLLKAAEQTLSVPGAKFIKLNLGQSGFYRASYSRENLVALGKLIKAGKMDPLDAWGVINDFISLAKSCRVKISDVLDFIEGYCMDCDYPVSSAVASYFTGLSLRFYKAGAVYRRADALESAFARKLLKRLGWEKRSDEPHYLTSQRGWAITTLGTKGDKAVALESRKRFSDMKSGRRIDNDLRGPVYRVIAANGASKEFEQFISLYQKSTTPEEQRALYGAFGNFMTPELNLRSLRFTMGSQVRPQDKTYIMGGVASNPIGKGLILDWTKKNWKALKKLYRSNASLLNDPIENLAILQTGEDLRDVERFFRAEGNYLPVVERTLKNTLESIEINKRFVEFNDVP